MRKILNPKVAIFTILVFAAFLRLWKLESVPPGLTSDEASLGYNAYSILKTGRDEYGQLLPIIFKSFGDYKPGLYVYMTVPSVAILGLNEFSTRLPSAIAGITAVLLIYLIVKEIGNLENLSKQSFIFEELGVLSAFLLAVCPWHIHFSRGAWEANLSLTLTLAGVYLFLRSLKNVRFIILSGIFFASTLLTYQGAKLSTTVVVLVLLVTYAKEVHKLITENMKYVTVSVIIAVTISLPILSSLFLGKTGRLTVFSIFSYPRPDGYLQAFLDEGQENKGNLSYYLFHSEALNFTRGVLGRWYNHFSGKFLFFEGDYSNPRHSPPNNGQLLLFNIVLMPLGVYSLVKRKSRISLFIFGWLILSPLSAALSRDQVHSVRALNMVIPLTLVSACGFGWLVRKFSPTKYMLGKLVFIPSVSLIMILNFAYYFDAYFIHLPVHDSKLWGYGFKELVEVITPIQQKYRKIEIQQSFAQPYIYFLFYQKYSPAKYQSQARLTESEFKGDVGYVTKVDNLNFVPIDWSVNRGDHNSLVVGDPIRIPKEDSSDTNQFKLVKEINYLDKTVAFRVIEVK